MHRARKASLSLGPPPAHRLRENEGDRRPVRKDLLLGNARFNRSLDLIVGELEFPTPAARAAGRAHRIPLGYGASMRNQFFCQQCREQLSVLHSVKSREISATDDLRLGVLSACNGGRAKPDWS